MGGIILEWRQKTTRRSQTYYYFAEQESEGYNKNIPNGKATFMSQAIDISITDRFVNHFLHFFKYQLLFYLFFPNLFSNWFTNTTNKHIIIVMEIVHLKFSAEDCQIACMHRTSVSYMRNS